MPCGKKELGFTDEDLVEKTTPSPASSTTSSSSSSSSRQSSSESDSESDDSEDEEEEEEVVKPKGRSTSNPAPASSTVTPKTQTPVEKKAPVSVASKTPTPKTVITPPVKPDAGSDSDEFELKPEEFSDSDDDQLKSSLKKSLKNEDDGFEADVIEFSDDDEDSPSDRKSLQQQKKKASASAAYAAPSLSPSTPSPSPASQKTLPQLSTSAPSSSPLTEKLDASPSTPSTSSSTKPEASKEPSKRTTKKPSSSSSSSSSSSKTSSSSSGSTSASSTTAAAPLTPKTQARVIATAPAPFYPEREGTMLCSKAKSTAWKKRYLVLKEGQLHFFASKGGKRITSLPASQCNVAGMVLDVQQPYVILSSPKSSLRISCLPEAGEAQKMILKEWGAEILKANKLSTQRSRRNILHNFDSDGLSQDPSGPINAGPSGSGGSGTNASNRKSVSLAYKSEIKAACQLNKTVQNIYIPPEKKTCFKCKLYGPVWESNERYYCLDCYVDVAQAPGSSSTKGARGSKKKKSKEENKPAPVTIKQQIELEESRNRKKDIEKRRKIVLEAPAAAPKLIVTPASRASVVKTLRHSLNLRKSLALPLQKSLTSSASSTSSSGSSSKAPSSPATKPIVRRAVAPQEPVRDEDTSSDEDLSIGELDSKAYSLKDFPDDDQEDDAFLKSYGEVFGKGYETGKFPYDMGNVRDSLLRSSGTNTFDDDESDFSSVEDAGDWNSRFQSIVQNISVFSPNIPEEDQISANLALIGLAHDFLYSARSYGKIIISEIFLPDSEKTIKPSKIGSFHFLHPLLDLLDLLLDHLHLLFLIFSSFHHFFISSP